MASKSQYLAVFSSICRIAALLLLAALLASCASQPPQYIEIQPECTAPPQPALPQIEGDELDPLPDDVYWRLENRERQLVDWAFELKAMIDELCAGPDEAPADTE